MDCRVQLTRYIISGLSALAAALMLSATALAASSTVVPCDQVGRNLKSLEVPVDALTVNAVEHIPTDRHAVDPNTSGAETHLPDAEAPILFLTPRVTNILRDVFGAATEELPAEIAKQPSSSPLADSEEPADYTEPADAVNETSDLPHYQRQMFRKDI